MKITWKILYKTLKYSINILNIIRITIANVFLIIFIIIGVIIYLNFKNSTIPTNPSALILNLTGTIVDQPKTFTKFQKIKKYLININQYNTKENSLFHITNIIRKSKHDPNITGIILLLKNFSEGSQSSLEYIGKTLSEFKNSGKPIYAISDYYNQSQYFLASYADKIYLTPQGIVDLRGIYNNQLYYQSLLKNLKINTHVFRAGTYKSAVEPFIRNNMSDPVRDEEKIRINQLWNQYLHTISINRHTTKKCIFPGINTTLNELYHMQGNTANYALQRKLIDKIAPYSIIENEMKKKFGINKKNNSFNSISMYDYNLDIPTEYNNQIAIICVQGIIIDGNNNNISDTISGDIIAHKIRTARLNPKIKAIILRVNSPGGSVHASELIRQEIISTRKSGIPIVVSMGNIAASGGYWISTPANFIIASRSTLTGSIGVFGIINTFEESLSTIGIYSDEVNTSPIANISMNKALPIEFKKMMQLYVDTSYQYFIKTVAQSRCKAINDINKIAQGHIWLGLDAYKNGLIDKIGDFDDAIEKAAELAQLKKYTLNWCLEKTNWMNFFLQQTDKMLYCIFSKLFNDCMLTTNFDKFNKINGYYNATKFIWNDPKHCYALYLKHICCK